MHLIFILKRWTYHSICVNWPFDNLITLVLCQSPEDQWHCQWLFQPFSPLDPAACKSCWRCSWSALCWLQIGPGYQPGGNPVRIATRRQEISRHTTPTLRARNQHETGCAQNIKDRSSGLITRWIDRSLFIASNYLYIIKDITIINTLACVASLHSIYSSPTAWEDSRILFCTS